MKLCPTCEVLKPISDFYKVAKNHDGLFYNCKKCHYDYRKQYTKENREKVNKLARECRKKKPEKYKSIFQKWAESNPDKVKKNNTDYAKKYPGKVTAKANKRYAKKKKAFPTWLTLEQIQQIENKYIECSILTKQTGIKYEVDHVIPLQSDLVCGLHVPWNLQIITKTDNLKKGNKF